MSSDASCPASLADTPTDCHAHLLDSNLLPPDLACLSALHAHTDGRARVATAMALLVANGSSGAWCSDPEDLRRFEERGWAVLRRAIAPEALAALAISPHVWSGVQPHSNSRFSGRSRGAPHVYRVAFDHPSEVAERGELRALLPSVLGHVQRALDGALRAGTLRWPWHGAVGGELFRIEPQPPPWEPAALTVSGGNQGVANDSVVAAGGTSRDAALHGARPLDWHSDSSHMAWVMLARTPSRTAHSSIEAAPVRAVRQLCALATDRGLRQLAIEQLGGGANASRRVAAARLPHVRPRGHTLRSQCRAMHPTRLFDHAACRLLPLVPGDALLLRRGERAHGRMGAWAMWAHGRGRVGVRACVREHVHAHRLMCMLMCTCTFECTRHAPPHL